MSWHSRTAPPVYPPGRGAVRARSFGRGSQPPVLTPAPLTWVEVLALTEAEAVDLFRGRAATAADAPTWPELLSGPAP